MHLTGVRNTIQEDKIAADIGRDFPVPNMRGNLSQRATARPASRRIDRIAAVLAASLEGTSARDPVYHRRTRLIAFRFVGLADCRYHPAMPGGLVVVDGFPVEPRAEV